MQEKLLKRILLTAFVAAGLSVEFLAPGSASAAPPEAAAPVATAVSTRTDHYVEAKTGTTLVRVDGGAMEGPITAAVPVYTPFDYTIDFTARLRGRNMYRPASGVFCNRFRADYRERPDLDPTIKITLFRDEGTFGNDTQYSTKTYAADGSLGDQCWGVAPNTGDAYYFVYEKNRNGFSLRGHGTAYHR